MVAAPAPVARPPRREWSASCAGSSPGRSAARCSCPVSSLLDHSDSFYRESALDCRAVQSSTAGKSSKGNSVRIILLPFPFANEDAWVNPSPRVLDLLDEAERVGRGITPLKAHLVRAVTGELH